MKLLTLVLLLSTFSSLTLTEVVKDFQNYSCSKFFIRSPKVKHIITPTVFKGSQYKQICQLLNNNYTFATLYDTKNRIPVYSAYTFSGRNQTFKNNEWKNEPQLEKMSNGPEMREITNDEMNKFLNQAVNRDYTESRIPYTTRHVFPNQYAADQNQADSTFTFTNIAPQTNNSNGEWEAKVEKPMRAEIQRECRQNYRIKAFIVTGVVPGNKWIFIRRKDNNNKDNPVFKGVNIPSFYWTAFCCYNQTTRISRAYLVRQNEPNPKSYEITRLSVDMLNRRLSSLYNQDFKVFSDLCLTSVQSEFVPSDSRV